MTTEVARETVLADATKQAERMLAEASLEADRQIEEASRKADEMLAHARALGRAEGRVQAGREEAYARTLARMDVLAAQRESYDELHRRARAAALALRDEPGYDELLARLAAAARRDLGENAQLEVDPPGVGGVRGQAGSRRVDYTLTVLADCCVDDLGPALARLWS